MSMGVASGARAGRSVQPLTGPRSQRPIVRPDASPEPAHYGSRDHLADVAAELRDLLDQARRQVRVLERGHEKDRVDLRRELAIGVRHLHLGLEVADCAQAADDEAGTDLEREVDGQAVEACDVDAPGELPAARRRSPRG